MMAFGLGVLRLPPAAFWALTLRELEAAIDGVTGGPPDAPPSRDDFTALMRRFPDAHPGVSQ
jgi:uncharacterized phage protein (TIGR02216 family)